MDIQAQRTEIEKQAKEAGIELSYVGCSDTNGMSIYFECDGVKYRFSDHSVKNIDRMNNEKHFDLPFKKTMGLGGVIKFKHNTQLF